MVRRDGEGDQQCESRQKPSSGWSSRGKFGPREFASGGENTLIAGATFIVEESIHSSIKQVVGGETGVVSHMAIMVLTYVILKGVSLFLRDEQGMTNCRRLLEGVAHRFCGFVRKLRGKADEKPS